MSLLERIRRLLKTPEPDLTRSPRRSARSTYPWRRSTCTPPLEQNYVGRDVDPDEPRSGRV